jgi:glycosyltransferase involved in cell wall biosynthesis
MLPIISVRIPTKNRAELLCERALASVFYQTYRNLEIVVVGDCCDDNTYVFLNRIRSPFHIEFINLPERCYQEQELMKDPEIRWFMGPVRATNNATELCQGEWIAHLDDDDIWTPDHIERSLDFALKGNYDFVSSSYIRKNNGKYEIIKDTDGIGGCQTWFYKTELAKRFPYNPDCWKNKTNRVSDTDVAERIRKSGCRIGFLDEVGAYVLPRPGEEFVGLKAYKK